MQSSHPSRAPGQSGSAATAALSRQASKAAPGSGAATPRRREKPKENFDVVARLKAICTDADPTKLYRSLVKIGQG
jgi:p21-activated kinase 1